ncbi:GNAT family N-acetyltransferase [Saccharibacillus alkalitolerans]|uniref:GNAT family N-acetyltransferase n=1 Tax=Saccharibacillus alkalitolerans TaxID=2705290 RepID=A0ABX0F7A9_9BACL|nr:GNAT family N-acetyltransferase [Saccharibacillus alkalitolerans]NGZ76697.1 GNAT family N-acetyltransferase [Saccharibacillus alkalitolerans]
MEIEKENAGHEMQPETLIRTPRMRIRRFAESEWIRLMAYLQDDGIADGFPEGAYTERRLRDMTADPYLYALVSDEDDEIIGHASCRPGAQPMTGTIGLGVRSDYRRHGYAGEAARALLRHSFGEMGLHRITAACPPENLALRALLEKLGMRMEAFFRQSLPTLDGEWKDECVYAMLRDEWKVLESLTELHEAEGAALFAAGAADLEESVPSAGEADLREEAYAAGAGDEYAAQAEATGATTPESEALTEAAELDTELAGSAALAVEPGPESFGDVYEAAEDPNVPQVTLPIGEAGGPVPFAPILPPPAETAPIAAEPAQVAGTVIGVQRAGEPDPLGGLIEQRIDGVPFLLRRPHDFNWLAPFGTVFRVWDRQDSGNLAFGLEIEGQKVWIKYAGAATAEYAGHPADAVRSLREAAAAYEALKHPSLVRMLDHFETPDGYAILFEWAEGELLRPGSDPDAGGTGGHTDTAISRFRRLPLEERIEAVESVIEFHAYAEALGYVAIDFYDGSLIYDFGNGRITICDIDLYRPTPYVNERGRMWGSSRFMSPEEYQLGAALDSRTNVYAMGAAAFCLLGGDADRSREAWEAGDSLYEAAARAVSPDREARWESVGDLLEAWRAAR